MNRSSHKNKAIKLNKSPSHPRFENLESRLFLSAAVMATVVKGNLHIRGDSLGNNIVLDQDGLAAGQMRITGANGTAINGQSAPMILSGITSGVDIHLGGGADVVALNDMSVAGNVFIDDHGGRNTVSVNNVQFAKSLSIRDGQRLSAVTIGAATVGGNLMVAAGSGGQGVAVRALEVHGHSVITSGRGAAAITVDDSTFHGATRINTGNGADVVQLDSGGAPLGLPTVFDGPLSVSLNGGNDILEVGLAGQSGNSDVFNGKMHFRGGAGFDTLRNFDAATHPRTSRTHVRGFESTAVPADTTAPTVSSTSPANNGVGIALNTKIAATFSEAMNPLTINSADVMVTGGGVSIPGTVAYVGTTMTFTPASPLAANTAFTLTITTGAQDLAGNALAANFSSTFTTGTTADVTPPTVSSVAPANNATGVALNKKIVAAFSEAMDPLTIVAANVMLTAPGNVTVPGSVAYSSNIMTFTPASSLAADTLYTLTIGTGVKDLAGNALVSAFTASFTTGATADTTAPTVSSTDPASNATGVSLNKRIAANFSEAMDPQSITAATVLVTSGNTTVAGAVSYAGNTVTFTPAQALAATTAYTVTITTGATDLAGNPLAHSYVWSFTSGAAPDTTAPTVLSTNPAANQTNVFINKTVSATFSESINVSTLTTASFTLTAPGNAPVAGTVSYDPASDAATFTPSSNLAPNTTFTATLAGGVNGIQDLAGNPLAQNDVWTFTTGSQVAQAPINLGSASTFAIMADSSISGTGATQINGDVGLNPGSSQGIPPNQVNGTIHIDDQAIITAQSDLRAAYTDATGRSATSQTLPGNMGGLTFTPGLYTNSSSVLIQGAGPANNVTLDAQGDPNAVFIFQMGSTLTTGPGAQVILAGGAKASNIFWQVGTSATLNTTTIFKGNILAAVSITVNGGSTVEGRLLAGSSSAGSVTVNASTVTVPTT